MDTRIKGKKKFQTTEPSKKTYQRPCLKLYGSINTLTASGSSGGAENASMSGPAFMSTSDPKLKENIVKIGDHFLGIGLYLFDYKPEFRVVCGNGRQFGVMADEVEKVMPEAVSIHPDGYKMVNYAMLRISRHLN